MRERLNLGPQPQLEILACAGDLELRGSPRPDVTIEGEQINLTTHDEEQRAVIESRAGSCTIRLPSEGSAAIGPVSGMLQIKNILGQVSVESVDGECAGRGIGSLYAGRVGGSLRMKRLAGPLTAGTIGGDVILQDVGGSVQIKQIGGDLYARNLGGSAEVAQISGNLTLRTAFFPETISHFAVGGKARFRTPAGANVRFVAPQGTSFHLGRGIEAVQEGEWLIVTLGDGSATVHIRAQGGMYVTSSDEREGAPFITGLEEDLDAHLAEVSARLDAHFAELEVQLSAYLAGPTKQRIEREIDAARRHIEAARRRVERAARRSHGPYPPSQREAGLSAWSPGGARAAHEPVSDDERLLILRMLEAGTISIEEAERLLSALEGGR